MKGGNVQTTYCLDGGKLNIESLRTKNSFTCISQSYILCRYRLQQSVMCDLDKILQQFIEYFTPLPLAHIYLIILFNCESMD